MTGKEIKTQRKYTLTNTSNTFQINQQNNEEKGTDKYENAHTQTVTMELSRKRDRVPSNLRKICRLKAAIYKKARQSGQRVSQNSISLV